MKYIIVKQVLYHIILIILYLQICCYVNIIASTSTRKNNNNKIYVDSSVGRFVLPDKREATFHGICLTESSTLQTVSGLVNITDEKAAMLKNLGFNIIRIGFHWNLYEISPNIFNETYMIELENLVNRLGNKHDFYIILDMHQDQMSERFCAGHGIPSFYSTVNLPEYNNNNSKAYPQPVAVPIINKSATEPPFIQCEPFLHNHHGSAVSLYTYYLGKAFQNLYDNVNGALDAYGRFWKKVASKFVNNKYIFAYEILNEPWYGEIPILNDNLPGGVDGYSVNDTLYFAKYNVKNLQNKLNIAIHNAIRSIDKDTILLFEPAAGGSRYDIMPSGFTKGPGGNAFNDRQAFAYHLYCANATNGGPWGEGNQEDYDVQSSSCATYVNTSVHIRTNDARKAGSAGATIVTEFGCTNNDTVGINAMEKSLSGFESVKNSWTIWSVQMMHYFQVGGVPGIKWKASPPPPNFINVLARPYVRYLANAQLVNSTYVGEKNLLIFFILPNFSLPILETEIYFPCSQGRLLNIEFQSKYVSASVVSFNNISINYVLKEESNDYDFDIVVEGIVRCE